MLDHVNNGKEIEETDGIFVAIGGLPSGTLITEDGLANLLGKACRETIKRAVERGELPRPVRLLGKNTWTVGSIIQHIEDRLKENEQRYSRMRT
jgi:predicted DNA-binding transcriptional regulator AlpA